MKKDRAPRHAWVGAAVVALGLSMSLAAASPTENMAGTPTKQSRAQTSAPSGDGIVAALRFLHFVNDSLKNDEETASSPHEPPGKPPDRPPDPPGKNDPPNPPGKPPDRPPEHSNPPEPE